MRRDGRDTRQVHPLRGGLIDKGYNLYIFAMGSVTGEFTIKSSSTVIIR